MIVRRVALSMVGWCRHYLLMAVKKMIMVEALHLVGDLARTQFAVAAPFVEESQEHAVWPKFILFT